MAAPVRTDYRAVAVQAAHRYGINPAIFLRQIQQESGFNPNARSPAGAVGIAQIVPHWHPGVDATNPIASLDYAAKYMATLVHKYGNYQSALSVYNSGSPTGYTRIPETRNYVSSIMGASGQPVGAVPPSPALGPPAAAPPLRGRGLNPGLLQSLNQTNRMLGMPTLSAGLFGSAQLPGLPPLRPGPLPFQPGQSPAIRTLPFKLGDPVPVSDLSSIGGLHPTEGLAGYMAHDYFANAGTPVVAPVGGRVIRLSGHDPRLGPIEGPHGPLGWSTYIQGNDGHIYYLTHMGTRSAKVGEVVRPGQVIGTVANYARYGTPSHIHMGVH